MLEGIRRWWFTRTSDFGGFYARCCAYSRVGGADRDGRRRRRRTRRRDDDDDESDADATATAAAAADDDDEHATTTTTTLGGGGGGGNDDDDSSSADERAVDLASSWTEHDAPDGRKYYYNQLTKKSTYEKPRELYTAKESFVFENCAWKTTYDKTSKKYYYTTERRKRRGGRLRRS